MSTPRHHSRLTGGDVRSEAREAALTVLYEAQAKDVSPRAAVAAHVLKPDELTALLVEGVEDHHDELDELSGSAPEAKQTTYTMNVESLTSPGEVRASPNNTTSTDHNLYIHDGHVFESNYTSGLRIFDEDSVPSGDLEEVAYFDLYPENDAPGFEGGTWSNYGHFRDGKIAVSSIDRGIFVLEPELDR